ncbi:hypothetical protein L3N51_02288 [Metallosphaera sp. J1]|nr:hypothetical protein [Metallosphaera javensis (ex Hofmann et al. 2022)]BCS93729.1 MAG: hypothetical protein MjAS7_2337 [Metallosphaera javensis (ex Sakai et al. 2022)]
MAQEEKGKIIEDCFMTWVRILEMTEKEKKDEKKN